MKRSEHTERAMKVDNEARSATLRPSTQAQRVEARDGCRLMGDSCGTVIVIDPLPADPAGHFYQCMARTPVMTMENSVLQTHLLPGATVPRGLSRGPYLPQGDYRNSMLITQAIWQTTRGDVALIRDSRPDGEGCLDTVLGSLFNNDSEGLHAFRGSVCDIRHGDILALSTASNIFSTIFTESSVVPSNPDTVRVFLFVDYEIGYVRRTFKLRASRNRMVGFRTSFDRFFSNLRKPDTYGSPTVSVALVLNAQKNDADLKEIRRAAVLDSIGLLLWFSDAGSRDIVNMIIDLL